jgi:NAD(P)-dependent dehydrogenase (short-subunit alcohol dehydrogenase family)
MAQFKGKVALVTGAASGIGKSTALLYAKEGASVIVSDLQNGEETVDQIKKNGGEAIFIKADVTKPDECKKMIDEGVKKFGRLDFACNNAGIGGETNDTADYSIEGWKLVVEVNLSAVFYCMKYQIPAMLKAGGGSIVNVASILGTAGFAKSPAYVASKHGVVGLTKTTAIEYATRNIRVNTIGPAFIRTPMISEFEENKEVYEMLLSLHPIGRLGKPEEVAELILWLSSDKASFVTGAYYPVDGGYLAR